jgi:MFS family permease
MMLSISTQYWQIFLSQGLGLGMGMGIVFNLSVAVPSHHFQRRRASALGVTASGSSAGGICLPIMIRRLTPVLGFAWTQVSCHARRHAPALLTLPVRLSASSASWRSACSSLPG